MVSHLNNALFNAFRCFGGWHRDGLDAKTGASSPRASLGARDSGRTGDTFGDEHLPWRRFAKLAAWSGWINVLIYFSIWKTGKAMLSGLENEWTWSILILKNGGFSKKALVDRSPKMAQLDDPKIHRSSVVDVLEVHGYVLPSGYD